MAGTRTVRDAESGATTQLPLPRRGRAAYILVAGLILLYAALLLRTAWLCDDSFITFRTVGNFVSGYGLVWNIGERVQAYTHPLWMFLLSGLFCVTGGEINNSAMFGSIALSLAAVLIYACGIARTAWHATLGLTVLVFSKAFVDYSTSGLESPLSYLLVTWFLLVYMRGQDNRVDFTTDRARPAAAGARNEGRGTGTAASGEGAATGAPAGKRPVAPGTWLLQLSLLASLVLLSRMDLALLIAPALLHACWLSMRGGRAARPAKRSDSAASQGEAVIPALDLPPTGQARSAGRPSRRPMPQPPRGLRPVLVPDVLLLGFLPLLAWEVFSVIYYGFPFPNTAYAKLSTGIPAADLARQGLHYFANSLRTDPLTLPAIGAAIIAAVVSHRARHLAIAAGIALYLLYVVKIGGDFMSGRFFAMPLLAGLAILGTLDIRGWKAVVLWSLGMIAAVGLGLKAPNPSVLTDGLYGRIGDGLVDARGIADERGYYYIYTGLLRDPRLKAQGSRKLVHKAVQLAKDARERHLKTAVSRDTIGLFGYHAGPEIHIVDLFALADPLLARLPAKPGEKWRIGHFEREVPDGYLESLQTGRNQITDLAVHDLYDKVLLATRGPLFTRQRWAAIWQLNVSGAPTAPSSQPAALPSAGAAGT